jgi:type I restriction enzyme S subunit
MTGELPEGWASARLAELSVILMGQSPPGSTYNEKEEGLPFFQGKADFAERSPKLRVWCSSPSRVAEAGDVLISVRAPVGPTNVADRTCAIGRGLAAIRPLGGIPTEWILYSLQYSRTELEEKATGSTFTAINRGVLENLELFIPPLLEQRRIVARVEALLDQVTRVKARLVRVQAILKRFRQAVLAAACSGRLTEGWREQHHPTPARHVLDTLAKSSTGVRTRRGVPDFVEVPEDLANLGLPASWCKASVAECLKVGALLDVKDGNHGANHPKVSEFTDEGLPFITAADVTGFRIDYEGAPKLKGQPLERLRVGFAKAGDAILTHKGSVGRSALSDRDCVLSPQATYYRPNTAVVDGRFLMYWFASSFFYGQLSAVMSQTTRDFVPISEQYRLFLALPPVEEQREIVRWIDRILLLAETIEASVKVATNGSNKLPRAILSRAFSGALVPQNPNDEPASVLLERIQAQRSGLGKEAEAAHRGTRKWARPTTPSEAQFCPQGRATRSKEVRVSLASARSCCRGQRRNGQQEMQFFVRAGQAEEGIAQIILDHMKTGREYTRAEIIESLNLSIPLWRSAIRELKESRKVIQTGEKRAARYRLS